LASAQPIGGAIADRLALGPSTITPLVKRRERGGFLERQRNPDDERQVLVRLTKKDKRIREDTACLTATLLENAA
jgi:MarR family transcriptional regulator, organic hydroperoxide resistance regulator